MKTIAIFCSMVLFMSFSFTDNKIDPYEVLEKVNLKYSNANSFLVKISLSVQYFSDNTSSKQDGVLALENECYYSDFNGIKQLKVDSEFIAVSESRKEIVVHQDIDIEHDKINAIEKVIDVFKQFGQKLDCTKLDNGIFSITNESSSNQEFVLNINASDYTIESYIHFLKNEQNQTIGKATVKYENSNFNTDVDDKYFERDKIYTVLDNNLVPANKYRDFKILLK